MQKPSIEELTARLKRDQDYFGGTLPQRNAIAWRGYFAALLEWDLISISAHRQLWEMLPDIEDDPVSAILVGR